MLAVLANSPAMVERAPVVAGIVGAAACAYTGLMNPADGGGLFPACPFHAVTGLWCPGCGSLRGIHHLLRGDVGAALSSNVLLVVLIPLVVWFWLGWLVPRWRLRRIPVGAVFVMLAVMLAFGFARNTDTFAALAP